jgi:hypothetical protein
MRVNTAKAVGIAKVAEIEKIQRPIGIKSRAAQDNGLRPIMGLVKVHAVMFIAWLVVSHATAE